MLSHGATPEFLHRLWDQRVAVLVVLAITFVAFVAVRAIVSAVRDPGRT